MTPNEVIFASESPSRRKWAFFIVLALLLDGFWFYATGPAFLVLPLFVILISLALWNIVGRLVNEKVVLARFQQWQNEMNVSPQQNQKLARSPTIQYLRLLFYRILGLHLAFDKKYYVEAHIPEQDLLNVRSMFRDRLLDVISASLGISFLIAALLRPFFVDMYENDPDSLLFALEVLVAISPILVCWLIPVIWTLKDSQIRSVDSNQIIRDQAESVGSSVISRFLGIAGIVAGFFYLLDLAPSFTEEEAVAIYQWTLLALLQLLFVVTGTTLLLTVVYLSVFHSGNVNRFRKKLAATLSLNVALARSLTQDEQAAFETAPAEYPRREESAARDEVAPKEIKDQGQVESPPPTVPAVTRPQAPKFGIRRPKFCRECGNEISESHKFCIRCGAPVPEYQVPLCHKCGRELSSSDRFCMDCGEPIPQYSPAHRPIRAPARPSPLISLGRILLGAFILYIGLLLLLSMIAQLIVQAFIIFFPTEVEWDFSITTLVITSILALGICCLGLKLEYGEFIPYKERSHHLQLSPGMEQAIEKYGIKTIIKALLLVYIFMIGYANLTLIYLFWDYGGDISQFASTVAFAAATLIIGLKWYSVIAMRDWDKERDEGRKAEAKRFADERAVHVGTETLYRTKKPSSLKWIVILAVALILQTSFYAEGIALAFLTGNELDEELMIGSAIRLTGMSIIAIILSIFLWKKVSALVMNRIVLTNLNLWKQEHLRKQGAEMEPAKTKGVFRVGIISKLLLRALNFRLDPNNVYYLEALGKESDSSSIARTFREKIIELTFTCLGIGFLLATALKPLFLTYGALEEPDFLFLVIVLILFSPVFVSWLMPVLWLLEDCQIRSIDSDKNIGDLSEDVRGGQLSQFLGLAGLVAGINFFIDIVPEIHDDIETYADQLWYSISYTMSMTMMLIASAFIVGMVYLGLFHENQVNEFRRLMVKNLSLGLTILRDATKAEKEFIEKGN
ncbi:MAG: zinc ribbon domain-containing protein [Candidatus Thorarchaeota archaeon]